VEIDSPVEKCSLITEILDTAAKEITAKIEECSRSEDVEAYEHVLMA
jgi:hypothetical protein